jgi:perosamine synthetase
MIPLFRVYMDKDVMKPLEQVLFSGFIGEGSKVVEFENLVKNKLGVKNVLTVNNGTAGLHLAYQMLINYDPNAEVIASPMTCSATLTPIIANRGKIVWADIDPITGNISPEDIEKKITKNTKAIVAMHWGGMPCDLDAISIIASRYGIPVIEDAAHAMGSMWAGEYIGNHSDFTMFSLQAIKHITSVDGGLLVVRGQDFYDRAKLLRWYGISREVKDVNDLRCELDISETGHKMHMSDVTAVIGMENFKHLDEIVLKHQENARYYDSFFESHGISFSKNHPKAESSYWLYTIHAANRDTLMDQLKKEGIMSSKVHTRNDVHSAFGAFKADLPNVGKFQDTHLCIPVGWWVTKENREFIADRVLYYIKRDL